MNRALVLAIAACGNGATPTPPQHVTRSPIPAKTTIVLTGVIDDWSSTNATLQLWSRDGPSAWQPSAIRGPR